MFVITCDTKVYALLKFTKITQIRVDAVFVCKAVHEVGYFVQYNTYSSLGEEEPRNEKTNPSHLIPQYIQHAVKKIDFRAVSAYCSMCRSL